MSKDAGATIRSEVAYSELERLSALETLKGLKHPENVTVGELVRYLERRGLWTQFAKITLSDLRNAFAEPVTNEVPEGARKRKRRILEDELEDALAAKAAKEKQEPEDGGISTDEVGRLVLPFIEGNGDVTLEDVAEYSRLERRVLRHHLSLLVKQGRLERIGVGRHAVYSAL